MSLLSSTFTKAASAIPRHPVFNSFVEGLKVGIIGGGPAAWAVANAIEQNFTPEYTKNAEPVDITMLSDSNASAAWSAASPPPLLSHQPRKYFSERLPGFDDWLQKNLTKEKNKLNEAPRGQEWLASDTASLTDKEDSYGRLPRSTITSFLQDQKALVQVAIAARPDMRLSEKKAEVTQIAPDWSDKLVVHAKDQGNQPFQESYDHVVLATGMTPPYQPREGLPKNFFDNMSAPVGFSNGTAVEKASDQFDLAEKRITSIVNRKKKEAIGRGESPDDQCVTVAIFGHGGATALDAEYYLNGLPNEIKSHCQFLKFGNPDSARPKAERPPEGMAAFDPDLGQPKTVDALFSTVAKVKAQGAKQGYSEGNMRPPIADKFMQAASYLTNEEAAKLYPQMLVYYSKELATEAAVSVDAANSLPNAQVIKDKVDFGTPEEGNGAYTRKNGKPAFTENQDSSITFYDVTGKAHTADICFNCTGAIWQRNPEMLKSIGVTDSLVGRTDFDIVGSAVAFLPLSDAAQGEVAKKLATRPGDIMPQIGATVEGAQNVGKHIAQNCR